MFLIAILLLFSNRQVVLAVLPTRPIGFSGNIDIFKAVRVAILPEEEKAIYSVVESILVTCIHKFADKRWYYNRLHGNYFWCKNFNSS